MRAVYRLLVWLVILPVLAWLRWRAPGSNDARANWRERLGYVKRPVADRRAVWVHAASVGEVNAAQALVRALVRQQPQRPVVISTLTATGRDRALALFANQVEVRFAPLDSVGSVRRWLDRINPCLAIIVETELWPELFHACRQRACPLVLVNARLTQKAMRQYRRFPNLFRETLSAATLALCRSEVDAERFRALGLEVDRIEVIGNLKFDVAVPDDIGSRVRDLKQRWGERPVWVAGSTREGEDEILLDAHALLLAAHSRALLVLAPRHPERANAVHELIRQKGLSVQTIGESIEDATQIVLVDRIGLLMDCYAAATAAFVGGSLVDIGGHNLLEPAALGKIVVSGPYLHEQADMAAALAAAEGLIEVTDARSLAAVLERSLNDPAWALEKGRQALAVVEAGRGSLKKTLARLKPIIATAD